MSLAGALRRKEERRPMVLLVSSDFDMRYIVPHLSNELPDARIVLWPEAEPDEVDIALCWRPPPGVLARLPRLGLIHSIGAGVDHIMADLELPEVPLCRVIDAGMTAGIREYVLWSVLYFQRGFDLAARQQRCAEWSAPPMVGAPDWAVGVLGLGAIGLSVALQLRDLGYVVRAWSRSPKAVEGITCFTGLDELPACLSACDVAISILPLTPETRGLFDYAMLSRLKSGAAFVNVGRGEQLRSADLVRLIDEGYVRGAVLDVFDTEPLPADTPLWSHPAVIVTPHMASRTHPRDIARQVAANWRRSLAGEPLIGLVDGARGY